jgi:hypothetical protein
MTLKNNFVIILDDNLVFVLRRRNYVINNLYYYCFSHIYGKEKQGKQNKERVENYFFYFKKSFYSLKFYVA